MQSKKILIGHVKGAKGLKGEIAVNVYAREAGWARPGQEIFLGKGDVFKPYRIAHFRMQKEELVLDLEESGDRTSAESLRGQEIWIDADCFVTQKGENIFLREILGFQVFDHDESIGPVKGFSSNGPQDLIILSVGKMDVLVPLVKDFIERIDFKTREIRMKLPPSLIDEQLTDSHVAEEG